MPSTFLAAFVVLLLASLFSGVLPSHCFLLPVCSLPDPIGRYLWRFQHLPMLVRLFLRLPVAPLLSPFVRTVSLSTGRRSLVVTGLSY